MKLVLIESPYAGDILTNVTYARRCMRDSLFRGEAPFASHLLYTQPGVLDDSIPSERSQGIAAGFAWSRVASLHAFYTDLGWSKGMLAALNWCHGNQQDIEFRALSGSPKIPAGEEFLPTSSSP